MKKAIISLIIFILIIGIILLTTFSTKNSSFNSSYKTISIYSKSLFLFPVGTNALQLNYTNLKIYYNVSGIISSVNTISEGYIYFSNNQNTSFLTSIYVPKNATISSISLNISNEIIEINNTKYVVNIINKTIYSKTINILNKSNQVNQSIILQISGSIIPIIQKNEINFFSYQLSSSYNNYSTYLKYFSKNLSALSITNYTLSNISNFTLIKLKIRNNMTYPVGIKSIVLYGKLKSIKNNSSINLNISEIKKLSNIFNYTFINYSISKLNSNLNSSGIGSELSSFIDYLKPITSRFSTTQFGNVLSGISGSINQNISSFLLQQLQNINYTNLSNKVGINKYENFSKIKNNITSTISTIKNTYLYSLNQKEAQLNYTTFIPLENNTLLLVSTNASELNNNLLIIPPKENVTLKYYGEITFTSNNIFIPLHNNTYMVWLIANNGLTYNYKISAS
ncbi:MAG: hypothetical protein QXD23_01065 [Candidatus Micrarchaeaceae archaeon]